MARQDDLDIHFSGALDYSIEVFYLEPQQHTISVGFVGSIADWAMVVRDFKAVQLEDQRAIPHQLLILVAAMSPAALKQALIPAAAGFDIRDADKRLRAHGPKRNKTGQGRRDSASASVAQPVAIVEIHWSCP